MSAMPVEPALDPATSLASIQSRIRAAAQKVGRDPTSVTLVAVSKRQPIERVEALLDADHRVFGENKVQEASERWSVLKPRFSNIRLHMVGPLQTNKAEDAVRLFDVIHSLDRPKLARKLADAIQKAGASPGFFVQVNTGEEPQKAGVLPMDVDAFITQCQEEYNLSIDGLMCLPPVDDEPSLHFALLAKFARRNGLAQLSMGMSADFEAAIALGATHVRIGTELFGPRPDHEGR